MWANSITPGYFRTLGIPLLRGPRLQRARRNPAAPPPGTPDFRVVIVNERFARQYLADGHPIGRRIGFGTNPKRRRQSKSGARPRFQIHGRPRRHPGPGLLPASRELAAERSSTTFEPAGPRRPCSARFGRSCSGSIPPSRSTARARWTHRWPVAQPRADGRDDDSDVGALATLLAVGDS